jgi:hypothetical protein
LKRTNPIDNSLVERLGSPPGWRPAREAERTLLRDIGRQSFCALRRFEIRRVVHSHLLPGCEFEERPGPAHGTLGRRTVPRYISTSIDIEPVTTFSTETNWSSMTNGSRVVLVGMILVSNRSNRLERFLLNILVVHSANNLVGCGPSSYGLGSFQHLKSLPNARHVYSFSVHPADSNDPDKR